MSKYTINSIEDGSPSFIPTIDPGVHEVEIMGTEVLNKDDDAKSTDVVVNMVNSFGSMKYVWHNYATEKSLPYCLKKAKHLAELCLKPDEANKVGGETMEELLVSMLSALEGKKVRILFGGEEYVKTLEDGTSVVRVKTVIGLPKFAEKLDIPAASTGLRFDKTNTYHYKPLDKAVREAIEVVPGAQSQLSEMNFGETK